MLILILHKFSRVRDYITSLLVMFVLSVPYSAYATELYLAYPSNFTAKGEKITKQLGVLLQHKADINVKTISAEVAGTLNKINYIIVAVGSDSLKEILAGSGDSAVIAVFISKATFEKIISVMKPNRLVTAVFSDPSPKRQIALIKSLYGASASAGIVSTPNSKVYIKEYLKNANSFGVTMKVTSYTKIHSISDLISEMSDVDTLILLKDPLLFENAPLDQILLKIYDVNHQGVIGYSSGIVFSGGLATTFSSLEDIATSLYKQIGYFSIQKRWLVASYTQNFNVSINKYILRSLNLTETNESKIYKEVKYFDVMGVVQ